MQLSRRELLTIFLGAPFALAACDLSEKRRFPDGEIVGQSVDLGHILRQGRTFQVPADNWETKKVAIVGAGIAGLSAAWHLSRNSLNDFVVLELEREPGGTARSGKGDPVSYPWGAHYLPVPFKENTELISLLEEMSLLDGRDKDGELVVKEQYLCREPEERLFYKGRWYEGLWLTAGASEDDKRQYQEFQRQVDHWVNWRDAKGCRAFVLPVEQCTDDVEATSLDRMSFADWFTENGFTSDRLRWYCD